MIMRITWGKLRAGTWQEYEQAYHATVAGKEVPGLRGRWLAQDVNDPDGGFSVSLWDTPVFPSTRGGPLGRDGVAHLLAKYVATAQQHCPS